MNKVNQQKLRPEEHRCALLVADHQFLTGEITAEEYDIEQSKHGIDYEKVIRALADQKLLRDLNPFRRR